MKKKIGLAHQRERRERKTAIHKVIGITEIAYCLNMSPANTPARGRVPGLNCAKRTKFWAEGIAPSTIRVRAQTGSEGIKCACRRVITRTVFTRGRKNNLTKETIQRDLPSKREEEEEEESLLLIDSTKLSFLEISSLPPKELFCVSILSRLCSKTGKVPFFVIPTPFSRLFTTTPTKTFPFSGFLSTVPESIFP